MQVKTGSKSLRKEDFTSDEGSTCSVMSCAMAGSAGSERGEESRTEAAPVPSSGGIWKYP